jgi:hypothetical protein
LPWQSHGSQQRGGSLCHSLQYNSLSQPVQPHKRSTSPTSRPQPSPKQQPHSGQLRRSHSHVVAQPQPCWSQWSGPVQRQIGGPHSEQQVHVWPAKARPSTASHSHDGSQLQPASQPHASPQPPSHSCASRQPIPSIRNKSALVVTGASSATTSKIASRLAFRISQDPWRYAQGRMERAANRPKEKCSPYCCLLCGAQHVRMWPYRAGYHRRAVCRSMRKTGIICQPVRDYIGITCGMLSRRKLR